MFSWTSLLHIGTRFQIICKFHSEADLQHRRNACLLRFPQVLGWIYAEGLDGHLCGIVVSLPNVREPPRRNGEAAVFLEPRGEDG